MLSGDFGSGTAKVEFDHNADGVPEASFNVNGADLEYDYDPRQTDPALPSHLGSTVLYYRMKKLDAGGVVTATGGWDSFRFSLENPPSSQLALQDLALVNDTGDSSSDKITTDPTLKGKI